MEELKITAKIQVCDYNELNSVEKKLIDTAKEAVMRAYTPYSGFQVGAAVGLANQENVAFPSGLCAERTALFYANSRFPNTAVDAIAVAAYTDGDFTDNPVSPCGACRQVILEAQNRYRHPVRMILYGKKMIYVIEQITDLLPLAFGTF
jgi:cytidine deaminase